MRKLRGEQIDIWVLNLDKAKPVPDALSGDETAHAQKMGSDELRSNYTRTRNYLRWLLSSYLDEEPNKIRFSYGIHGKPVVRLPKTKLNFNISHSQNITVFAFSLSPVGIDIEKIRHRDSLDKISERYFSNATVQFLKELPEKNKLQYFFRIWSISEAYIKGLGESAFSIEKIKDKIEMTKITQDQFQIDDWKIFSLNMMSGFATAVAVKAEDSEIKVFKL